MALPGGFVDYGETLERAAIREAKGGNLARRRALIRQFHAYSDSKRDARQHNVTGGIHRKAPWKCTSKRETMRGAQVFSAKIPCPPKLHLITKKY